MTPNPSGRGCLLHILDTPEQMATVEELQRLVWPGNETDVVPSHLLVTAAHNGGVVIGAYESDMQPAQAAFDDQALAGAPLIGFVFGFPGLYFTPDGPRPKHCSHMLAVHPAGRDRGTGFILKRAQWQMVRQQGLDLITWTYDPLLSRNGHLNITRLGAVCNTYIREAYGEMRDGLNAGVPSDRFQVDWWINSQRVLKRLSKRARGSMELEQYLKAGIPILNSGRQLANGLIAPATSGPAASFQDPETQPILLLEIPADFQAVKAIDPGLALEWRMHTRQFFEWLFQQGYLVTDFAHQPGQPPRSYYVLSYGESPLPGAFTK
jgi:predicted GNAT superfamily acetyltransferase